MDEVFIVTDRMYSDFRLFAAFSTREQANNWPKPSTWMQDKVREKE